MPISIDLLTDDEIRLIDRLTDSLDRSRFDFLQLEADGFHVSLSKGEWPLPAVAPDTSPAPTTCDGEESEALVDVKAPLLGYCSFRTEAAAPALQTGLLVDETTILGLITQMDVTRPVMAGTRGVVTEICATEAEFVEYGQALCRIRPVDEIRPLR